MQLYLSFSYRDLEINGHFFDHFVEESIPLKGDQKTDVWCVPKLERSLREVDGFVSIIPRRKTEQGTVAFSQYIRHEVNMARRARVPRLLFVDDEVFRDYELQFPEDVIVFSPGKLAEQAPRHREAIRHFRGHIQNGRRAPAAQGLNATLIASPGKANVRVTQGVHEILRRRGFTVHVIASPSEQHGLGDIDLLEALWRSELCVFMLGEKLSDAHVALAMAHANFIPSFRLQHDPRSEPPCLQQIDGLIRWRDEAALLKEFGEQVTNFVTKLVRVDQLAREGSSAAAARSLATPEWQKEPGNLWDVSDVSALIRHVRPDDPFAQDQSQRAAKLNLATRALQGGQTGELNLCRAIYDSLRTLSMSYGLESPTAWRGTQAIRSIGQIETHRTATCIDVACLFASVLEASHLNAIVLIIEGAGFAHAIAGYRSANAPSWRSATLGDIQRAVDYGDAVIFESTGVLAADSPVGAETPAERSDKVLVFSDAIEAAKRMLQRPGVVLRGFVDVRAQRS